MFTLNDVRKSMSIILSVLMIVFATLNFISALKIQDQKMTSVIEKPKHNKS